MGRACTVLHSLSLHDALPISNCGLALSWDGRCAAYSLLKRLLTTVPKTATTFFRSIGSTVGVAVFGTVVKDRKSTRLNSSHVEISYAVFCLKKKKDDHVLRTN